MWNFICFVVVSDHCLTHKSVFLSLPNYRKHSPNRKWKDRKNEREEKKNHSFLSTINKINSQSMESESLYLEWRSQIRKRTKNRIRKQNWDYFISFDKHFFFVSMVYFWFGALSITEWDEPKCVPAMRYETQQCTM